MKAGYRIGVFGSASVETAELAAMAERTGDELGQRGCTLITGACSGLPYLAARAASAQGGEVWGFSPVRNLDEQRRFTPEDDLSIYSRIFYLPESFPFVGDLPVCKKYRNVISTANCDAGIIISGRWGTLNEFTNLVDFGKIVGVLTGSGGVADRLKRMVENIGEDEGVFFSDSPEKLVAEVIAALVG